MAETKNQPGSLAYNELEDIGTELGINPDDLIELIGVGRHRRLHEELKLINNERYRLAAELHRFKQDHYLEFAHDLVDKGYLTRAQIPVLDYTSAIAEEEPAVADVSAFGNIVVDNGPGEATLKIESMPMKLFGKSPVLTMYVFSNQDHFEVAMNNGVHFSFSGVVKFDRKVKIAASFVKGFNHALLTHSKNVQSCYNRYKDHPVDLADILMDTKHTLHTMFLKKQATPVVKKIEEIFGIRL